MRDRPPRVSVPAMPIIAAVDRGAQGRDVLELAHLLADLEGQELVAAHVYHWADEWLQFGPEYHAAREREATAVVADAVAERDGVAERLVLPARSPARGLHALARERDAAAVVVGSCHRGRVGRTLLGGTGERLLHGAPCAVAVAPRGFRRPEAGVRSVGVAFDGSPESRAALERALQDARRAGAPPRVITVVEPVPVAAAPGAPALAAVRVIDALAHSRRELLDEALAGLPPDVDATGQLLEGPVAPTLAEAASDLDLLVCGSRGHGPLGTLLLGGVTHHLTRDAPCPLLILPRAAVADAG